MRRCSHHLAKSGPKLRLGNTTTTFKDHIRLWATYNPNRVCRADSAGNESRMRFEYKQWKITKRGGKSGAGHARTKTMNGSIALLPNSSNNRGVPSKYHL